MSTWNSNKKWAHSIVSKMETTTLKKLGGADSPLKKTDEPLDRCISTTYIYSEQVFSPTKCSLSSAFSSV